MIYILFSYFTVICRFLLISSSRFDAVSTSRGYQLLYLSFDLCLSKSHSQSIRIPFFLFLRFVAIRCSKFFLGFARAVALILLYYLAVISRFFAFSLTFKSRFFILRLFLCLALCLTLGFIYVSYCLILF